MLMECDELELIVIIINLSNKMLTIRMHHLTRANSFHVTVLFLAVVVVLSTKSFSFQD